MTKILMCRDIGVDCDVVFEGATDDEIMEKVGQHASSANNLPNMPPNLEKKSREAITDNER